MGFYEIVLNFFRKDLLLKLVSLIVAIMLWFFVVIKGQTEITLNVPLELKYIPKGLGVESKSTSSVSISIRGFEQIIKNLKPYDIKVSVDLSKAKKGVNLIDLSSKDVIVPSTLTVTAIEPSTVRIRLEEIRSKKVPVLPEIIGIPRKGYVIETIRVEPETVEVEGLRPHTDRLRYIKTEPISVDNLNESMTFTAMIEPPSGALKISPESVRVKILLRRQG